MHKEFSKRGFTATELALSIAFIAVLSIAVILIITNTISSYHRGLTLNKINTTGMDLVDDMRAAVQNSPARSVEKDCKLVYSDPNTQRQCEANHARNFVSVTRRQSVNINGSNVSDVPVFGAFCTGMYSYIWNSGYFFSETARVNSLSRASLKYNLAGNTGTDQPIEKTATNFKLLKIRDEEHAVCISAIYGPRSASNNGNYNVDPTGSNSINRGSNQFDITEFNSIDEEPIDILSGTYENNLALYSLTSSTPSESVNHSNLFYSISFVLGTLQGGINVKAASNFCVAPEGYNSSVENFDYCAINKFNFAAQAMGG